MKSIFQNIKYCYRIENTGLINCFKCPTKSGILIAGRNVKLKEATHLAINIKTLFFK